MGTGTTAQAPLSRATRDLAPNMATPLAAHQILNLAPVIVYVFDLEDEQVVFQNKQFHELLGYPPTDPSALEDGWRTLLHPEDMERLNQHREKLKALRQGETVSCDYRMKHFNGSWRWFLSQDALATDAFGAHRSVVGSAVDITAPKAVEERMKIAAGEMRHRSRNFAALIEAIARQSRPKDDPQSALVLDQYVGRLHALLAAGDIVLSSADHGADFLTVASTTLAPFMDAASRISIGGDALTLSEAATGGLALALHELATNAMKYGSLSCSEGKVSLHWEIAGDHVQIVWRERGGPQVAPPTRRGFGTLVVESALAREARSAVHIDYRPDGLCCCFAFDRVG